MGILAAFMVPHPPLIVPEVGRGEERKIQKTIDAFEEIAQNTGALRPETIVLISPHQTLYADYIHISPGKGAKGDFGQFRAGQVRMETVYDTEFVRRLCQLADQAGLAAGTDGEREKRLDHGTMVPLYFIHKYWKSYRLVRIGLSGLPLTVHYRLGQLIRRAADELGKNTVLIASGDLSHKLKADGPYGYQKEGSEYDRRVMEAMGTGDFAKLFEFSEDFCKKAAECGHRSFTILAGALDRTQVKARRLSYEGPFGVGYGICAYEICGGDAKRNFREQYDREERERILKQRKQEDAYVKLARDTIETYISSGKIMEIPEGLPQEMYTDRAGVFVSIKEEGRLRGCIGTLQAVQPSIAQEIVKNAVSASTEDPRFAPIRAQELDKLSISVDVLGGMEQIDTPDQLDVKRYGVVVSKGRRRGLLLPNLEGVDTIEEQIAIARQKAGIGETEQVELQRFEVVRH